LLKLDGIVIVTVEAYAIKIKRAELFSWDELLPPILHMLPILLNRAVSLSYKSQDGKVTEPEPQFNNDLVEVLNGLSAWPSA
jgi:hypothetical protein